MNRIKVGVVGVGYLGQHHARIYSKLPEVELVGVVDIDEGKSNAIAAQAGCQAYQDFHPLLDKIDAVSIAVPTLIHHEIALSFLRAGVDVLLEKPMTVTLDEADDLIREAEKRGNLLQIGHLERFNSVVRALDGRIDKPRFIESHRLGPFVERGTDVHVVLDLMIHDIDIILSLVNSPVELIRAVGVPVISPQIDIANARIEFSSGCVANVTASRVSREKMRKIRIFQPDAYLSLDYLQQEVTLCRRVAQEQGERPQLVIERLEIQKEEPLEAEIAAFIDCVRTRKRPIVSGQEGREALRVALEILKEIKN
ncbi:MAG: Gfo/Idh/MocA family protein [Nitrospiria bacterium]